MNESTGDHPLGGDDPTLRLRDPVSDDAPTSSDGPDPAVGPPPAGPPPVRRITRSPDGRVGGVAAGIADYFAVDPLLVRLAFVVATFMGGFGLAAYGVAWLVIPAADTATYSGPRRQIREFDGRMVLAVVLLAGAAMVGIIEPFDNTVFIPLVLLAGGIFLLWQQPPGDAAPNPESAPPTPTTFAAPAAGLDDQTPPPPVAPVPSPRPPRPPSVVSRFTLSVVLLVFAAGALWNQVADDTISVTALIATALAVTGLGIMVGAVRGRARGLIPLGLVLALALGVSAVAEPIIDDGIGERRYVVSDFDDLRPAYRLGIGELVVDLRSVELPPGSRTTVDVDLGIGDARLLVPDGTIVVDADVDLGDLTVFGRNESGSGNRVIVTDTSATDTEGDAEAPGTLVVEFDVTIGEGTVSRG